MLAFAADEGGLEGPFDGEDLVDIGTLVADDEQLGEQLAVQEQELVRRERGRRERRELAGRVLRVQHEHRLQSPVNLRQSRARHSPPVDDRRRLL